MRLRKSPSSSVRREVGDPPVVAGGPLERGVAGAADVHRDRRGDRRVHLELGEVVEVAVVLDHLAGPHLAQHVELLVGPLAPLAERLLHEVELLLAPAHADAEGHPVARDGGGGADRLGHVEHVAHREHVHVGEEVEPLGGRGHRADRHPRVGPRA